MGKAVTAPGLTAQRKRPAFSGIPSGRAGRGGHGEAPGEDQQIGKTQVLVPPTGSGGRELGASPLPLPSAPCGAAWGNGAKRGQAPPTGHLHSPGGGWGIKEQHEKHQFGALSFGRRGLYFFFQKDLRSQEKGNTREKLIIPSH